MAAFRGMFDPSGVAWLSDDVITLSDGDPMARPAHPADPFALAVTRPGLGRHAGRSLEALRLRAVGALEVRTPAAVVVRHAALAAPLPDGTTSVLELTPLPFVPEVRGALARLRGGAPTWYVTPTSALSPPPGDDLVLAAGTLLATLATGELLVLGYLPQDAVQLPTSTWLHAIAEAMPGGDGDPWRALAARVPGRLIACGHTGRRVAAGTRFGVELRAEDGSVAAGELTVGGDGDLEAAIAASPIAGVTSLLDPPAGQAVHLAWRGEPPAGAALPVVAHYETGRSAGPGEWLALAPGLPAATLHVLELTRWFVASSPSTSLADLHAGCRIEPLVDGAEAFFRLHQDLLAAQGPGLGAELMGWKFLDTRLRFGDDASRFSLLATAMAQARAEALRILSADFDQIASDPPEAVIAAAVLLAWIFISAELLYALLSDLAQSGLVTVMLMVLPALIFVFASGGALIDYLRDKLGDSAPVLDAINAGLTEDGQPVAVAVFTRHPAQLADNPLTAGDAHPLFGLEADVAGVGIFHNKYQVVTRSAGGEVPDGTGAGGVDVVHAAHVGGIDINPNRLTTTAHQARGPMHDVHARLRGPVVSDVARTFAEFWDYARSEPSALDPDAPRVRSPAMAAEVALPVPLSPPPHVFTADEDPHLARLVRTIHRPRPGGFEMPFAPTGDDSAVRSMEAALAAAEDYIYIEDQYFTPHDGFVDLLVAAAARCRRLIVIVPAVSDQPFGGERREAVYARLRAAWGSRFLVGAPHRRPLVAAAGRATHLGRVNLLVVAEAEANRIWVGPVARVTGEPPFWLWIAGEQMLVTGVQKPVAIAVGDTILTSAQLDVVRGGAPGAPRWGAHPRRHPAGAAVTFAQPFGIYNHAKTMMIDDLFVSIGSTNINRRGFYHDGEIGVVAVPQALRGSPSNPARVLRTRLWAEHLGIPPAMGPAVLADPVAASDLFFRSRWVGNRFAPSSSVDPTPYFPIDVDLYPVTFFQILKQLIPALENTTANIAHLRVWNFLVDPTSYLQAEPDRELV